MISEMKLLGRLKGSFLVNSFEVVDSAEEAGGGVIGYVDEQLVYLHQGC